MCGIVGLFAADRIDVRALEDAIRALDHRGPDGSSAFIDTTGRVGLGHTRLAIIDLSEIAGQPMTSRDGRYTITFNGEIYNYREVRATLTQLGVTFRTQSDTEVLLEGFARLGPQILDKLNGIFAFAIHDAETNDVFVVRDQLGVKPVYYAQMPQGVAFASEVKALLALVDISSELDPVALRRYVTFLWTPGNETLLRQVKKLAPGHIMHLRDGAIVRSWRYWRPPAYTPRRGWNWRDCAAELAETVDRCVTRQMVADVPVGAFLSGGLDSSSIVAAARRQAPDIACFTIDAGAEPGVAEDLPYARSTAQALGVHLDEVRVDTAEFCRELENLPFQLDEPLADPACLNVLFIARLARERGIKVLLSGAGGDDLFTGYRRHTALALDGWLGALPSPLRRGAAAALRAAPAGHLRMRQLKKLLRTIEGGPKERILACFTWAEDSLIEGLLSPDLRDPSLKDAAFAPLEQVLAEHAGDPPVERCLALEQRFFLADHNLAYTDKMSMAAGVETRVPLLDLELLEFASRIPTEWKLRGLTPKWIFKQSQVDRLPRSTVFRPKTGFGAPLRQWLRGPLKPLADELLSPDVLRARGLFDPSAVERLRRADEHDETDGAYVLFSLMCIELWCRRFIDRTAKPSAMLSTGGSKRIA